MLHNPVHVPPSKAHPKDTMYLCINLPYSPYFPLLNFLQGAYIYIRRVGGTCSAAPVSARQCSTIISSYPPASLLSSVSTYHAMYCKNCTIMSQPSILAWQVYLHSLEFFLLDFFPLHSVGRTEMHNEN